MDGPVDTHSRVMGYLLWVFGFTGSHRFCYWTLNRQASLVNSRG